MKIGIVEISDLTDTELVLNYRKCLEAEGRRLEASRHKKFDTKDNQKGINFPTQPNSEFLNLKNAIFEELSKRNLTTD